MWIRNISFHIKTNTRGGSRTTATSKMERLVIILNDWKPLTTITKRSILDVAAVLDLPLNTPPRDGYSKFPNLRRFFLKKIKTAQWHVDEYIKNFLLGILQDSWVHFDGYTWFIGLIPKEYWAYVCVKSFKAIHSSFILQERF